MEFDEEDQPHNRTCYFRRLRKTPGCAADLPHQTPISQTILLIIVVLVPDTELLVHFQGLWWECSPKPSPGLSKTIRGRWAAIL